MQGPKIVMLTSRSISSRYMFNGLIAKGAVIDAVILEQPIAKKKLFKGRIKKLGWVTVLGQLLFILIVPKLLNLVSKGYRKRLESALKLNGNPFNEVAVYNVSSVNHEDSKALLKQLNPDIVIVNGTRIIRSDILNAIQGVFINTHVGITPSYRGVHGGYWALANGDNKNFGVTVHLVNAGIDTGDILYQKYLKPGKQDNFITYPLLQIASGIELMYRVIEDVNNNNLQPISNKNGNSQLWYHPTLLFYLKIFLKRGVK